MEVPTDPLALLDEREAAGPHRAAARVDGDAGVEREGLDEPLVGER